MKCSFVFNLKNTYDYDGCREWFEKALALPFHKQMVWGISDIKDHEQFGKLMAKHSNDAVSIYPPIDLDGAMEQLAEQAANEDKNEFQAGINQTDEQCEKRERSANRGICEEMPRHCPRKCEERH